MEIKRAAINFVFGFLLPSFTYILLEKLTEHIVIAVGGSVTVLTVAYYVPTATTGLKALDNLIERLRRQRRQRYLDEMCEFLNTYTHILTKYPPALLPKRLSRCVDAHIDVLAHTFQSLQARRTQTYATPYDMIRTLRFRPQDFRGWRLADCEAWWMELLAHLSQLPDNPMKRALQLGLDQAETHLWAYHMETAEQRFDQAFEKRLAQHPLLQHIRDNEALRQHAMTLIQTDTVSGQAHLQIKLQQHVEPEFEDDIEQLVALLRHDVVADALLDQLSQPVIQAPAHSGQNPS